MDLDESTERDMIHVTLEMQTVLCVEGNHFSFFKHTVVGAMQSIE
jgi:hypothetical protein